MPPTEVCGLPLRRQPGREQTPVPVAGDDAPAIRDSFSARSWPSGHARDRPSALKPGGDAEDLGARPVTEAPGRKGERSQVRLQVARRQVDDQPPDLALVHRRQLGGDDPDMPACRDRVRGVNLRKQRVAKLPKFR